MLVNPGPIVGENLLGRQPFALPEPFKHLGQIFPISLSVKKRIISFEKKSAPTIGRSAINGSKLLRARPSGPALFKMYICR
jgi:hypothetical protein